MIETNLPNGSQWDSNKTYVDQDQDAQNWVNNVRHEDLPIKKVKIRNKIYDCKEKDGVLVCLPCKP